jgi:prevent-host-death family protein
MAISITDLKHRCLEIVREIERTGKPVFITRRGKVVACIHPSADAKADAALKPWERLRGSAECHFGPEESVLRDEDFEALR